MDLLNKNKNQLPLTRVRIKCLVINLWIGFFTYIWVNCQRKYIMFRKYESSPSHEGWFHTYIWVNHWRKYIMFRILSLTWEWTLMWVGGLMYPKHNMPPLATNGWWKIKKYLCTIRWYSQACEINQIWIWVCS